MRKLHYHLADPPELISDCLRCKKPECTNCLERKLRTAPRKAAQAGGAENFLLHVGNISTARQQNPLIWGLPIFEFFC